jgi:hypothetical protein
VRRHWSGASGEETIVKYMILTYASQQDYDGMAGKATGKPAWSAEDFAAMGAFMEKFNQDLAESGELVETRGLAAPGHGAPCPHKPAQAAAGTARRTA